MAFRTILTLAGIEEDDRDIRLAAGLCDEVGAHLSVMIAAFAPPPPVGEYAVVVSDGWVEERDEDQERLKSRAAAVTAMLATMQISSDVRSDYMEIAWASEVFGRHAQYADLTVIGPALLGSSELRAHVLEGVLFSSGKPLLLVPAGSRPTLRPKRVMIAWDSRIEASRAVREALELLVGADEVRLVMVDPVASEFEQGAEPGADIAVFLARHGVKVTVDRVPSEGRSVVETLRRHAVDSAADLLVMGAYGHSRLRERIFGGVTRSILDAPPMPILMAR